jgi:DNA-binding response OmpR family regulator
LRRDEPGLDGYGVIAALRADAETVRIPFIFLTAKAEKPDIRAGMNLGADDYLAKPVAKADLLAAIHSRLECVFPASSDAVKTSFHCAPDHRWAESSSVLACWQQQKPRTRTRTIIKNDYRRN